MPNDLTIVVAWAARPCLSAKLEDHGRAVHATIGNKPPNRFLILDK
jgi:hypothetical protein